MDDHPQVKVLTTSFKKPPERHGSMVRIVLPGIQRWNLSKMFDCNEFPHVFPPTNY